MTTPLIEDPLLVRELDRHFKTHYCDKNETAKQKKDKEENNAFEDPREAYPANSQLESIQEQRKRVKRYAQL